ncbi:hypothetical protein T4E_1951 [Trichinella pseudospiralis]|uniref:Uncharacterized protein n=1 Tax=Trichinella pseudospiralis TaxID=6337 RepID=A0A0V0YJ74_TRIPS|nr:hypothetical protein T4E_1951 [Trichinella pseudospiralis]
MTCLTLKQSRMCTWVRVQGHRPLGTCAAEDNSLTSGQCGSRAEVRLGRLQLRALFITIGFSHPALQSYCCHQTCLPTSFPQFVRYLIFSSARMKCPLERKRFNGREWLFKRLLHCLEGNVRAVSYTHLDVYKRQVYSSPTQAATCNGLRPCVSTTSTSALY